MLKSYQESFKTFSDSVIKPTVQFVADQFKPAISVQYNGASRQTVLFSILKITMGMGSLQTMKNIQPRLLSLLISMTNYITDIYKRPYIFKMIMKEFADVVKFALTNVDKEFLPMNEIIHFYDGVNGINFEYMKKLSKRVNAGTKRFPPYHRRLSWKVCKAQCKILEIMEGLLDYYLRLPVQNHSLYQCGLDDEKLKRKIQKNVRYLTHKLLNTCNVDEKSWLNGALWFLDPPYKLKNICYWYSIERCCSETKYNVEAMANWMVICTSQYPGHIFSLEFMQQLNEVFDMEANTMEERDREIFELLKKDPIAFDILQHVAFLFDKIINGSAEPPKVCPAVLASYLGLSDALIPLYPEATAFCTFRELEEDRERFVEQQTKWFKNLASILSNCYLLGREGQRVAASIITTVPANQNGPSGENNKGGQNRVAVCEILEEVTQELVSKKVIHDVEQFVLLVINPLGEKPTLKGSNDMESKISLSSADTCISQNDSDGVTLQGSEEHLETLLIVETNDKQAAELDSNDAVTIEISESAFHGAIESLV